MPLDPVAVGGVTVAATGTLIIPAVVYLSKRITRNVKEQLDISKVTKVVLGEDDNPNNPGLVASLRNINTELKSLHTAHDNNAAQLSSVSGSQLSLSTQLTRVDGNQKALLATVNQIRGETTIGITKAMHDATSARNNIWLLIFDENSFRQLLKRELAEQGITITAPKVDLPSPLDEIRDEE